MGKSRYVLASLAFLASAVAMSAAQASVVVTVWGGANLSANYTGNIDNHTLNDASLPVPTGAQTASFTWTGAIDWTDNSGNNGADKNLNLFGSFFLTNGGTLANITNYSSGVGLTEAQFLATSISSLDTSPGRWWSYIEVTGTSAAGTATISHDDGASVYQGGPCIYCSPGETSDIAPSFAIGAGAFQVAYIEANGSPSDLTLSTPAVPEASTWAMMLLGFAGIGFMAYRRRNQGSAFRLV